MGVLLNIETATQRCSVAIGRDGELVASKEEVQPFQHARVLTQMIQDCLASAHLVQEALDGIAVSSGPGSYTALRIGTAVAKGMCFALDIPLLSVSTLESLAYGMRAVQPVADYYFPMIDARRMEVYLAVYDAKMQELEAAAAVVVEEGIFDTALYEGKRLVFGGNGAAKCAPVLAGPGRYFLEVENDAQYMVALSEAALRRQAFEDLAYYEPLYLKAPHITTPKKRLL